MEHTGRIRVQVAHVDRTRCTVVPESPIEPHPPTGHHVGLPAGTRRRHPVVQRHSQPVVHRRPLEQAIARIGHSVPFRHQRTIAQRLSHPATIGRRRSRAALWWWEEDLNLRRLCRQIYSLLPLTAWVPLPKKSFCARLLRTVNISTFSFYRLQSIQIG